MKPRDSAPQAGEQGSLRERIERTLRESAFAAPEACASVEELAQEISVYYQELEFQNEELKRIREELEESRSLYRELFEFAPIGIVIYRGDLSLHSANRTFLRFAGKEDAQGLSFAGLVAPESQDGLYFHVRELLRRGRAEPVRIRIAGPGGHMAVLMESNLMNLKGERLVRSALTDITERESSDRLVKENEAKFQLLFDFIPMGITIADAEGRIISANKAASRILGLRQEEHSERSIDGAEWRILRRDGSPMPPEEYASVRALREGRLVEGVEMLVERPGRDATWLLTNATPTGIPGFDLAISYLDISALVEKENSLRLNERKLRLYLDNIPQPIVITDAAGIIQDVNRALSELYGYTREEAVGSTPRVLNPGREVYRDFGYSDADYERLFGSLWEALRDPARGSWKGTLINRRKDGSLVWVELLVKSLFDESGSPFEYIALPVDISNLKESEQKGKVELYKTIATLSELRDNETGNHMKRVGSFSRLLGKALGMPEKYCEDLELFAPMHDIGKVGIPDSILLAPRALTKDELVEMRRHTALGHAIVAGKREMQMAAEITLGHHECWDGSGYPSGLAGEAIPLSARIAAISDVYDALRSRRPYKEPWTHEAAMEEILRKEGRQFDPRITAAFRGLHEAFSKLYDMLRD